MASTRSKAQTQKLTPHEEAILVAFQIVADDPTIDPTQAKALKMLLDGPINYNQIAEQCGITTATLWRWRQLPAFKAALTLVKRSILGDTAIKLVLEVDNSIDALVRLRDDIECPANVQLAAGKAIVDYAFKHVEMAEITVDSAVLESRILEDENKQG